MKANDVRKMPWKNVTDWSKLQASFEARKGHWFVSETDVDIFIKNLYQDISRKLNISYNQLSLILVAENEIFYQLKKKIFTTRLGYYKTEIPLVQMKQTLRVPDIYGDNLNECLELFQKLSDNEKMKFLRKIGRDEVNVEYLGEE